MKSSNIIAFFDSGIGGLSVLFNAMGRINGFDFLYYSDAEHVPYGNKSVDKVRNYIFEAANFIAQYHPAALVIACNTATSIAIKQLRKEFDFPIIGMEPAVKPAVTVGEGKNILVLATQLTLKEAKIQELVKSLSSENIVKFLPLQKLVTFAENQPFDILKIERYLRLKFLTIDWAEYSGVVLGCTHFVFFSEIIKNLIPININIFDGVSGTVSQLIRSIEKKNKGKKGRLTFIISGKPAEPSIFEYHLNYLRNMEISKIGNHNSLVFKEFIKESLLRFNWAEEKIFSCIGLLDEEQLWHSPNKFVNSTANLVIHLCGNIQQYINSSLGRVEDSRNRDLEFSSVKTMKKEEIIGLFEACCREAKEVIKNTTETSLLKVRQVQGFPLSGLGIILHVVEHLSYHTGQIAQLTKIMIEKDLDFYAGTDLNIKNS